tara:strand:- start:166 stop:300 length:135 start_codon:yes stop_codon:yes gene_type:complete
MGNIISKLPELYNAEKQIHKENDMKNKECINDMCVLDDFVNSKV